MPRRRAPQRCVGSVGANCIARRCRTAGLCDRGRGMGQLARADQRRGAERRGTGDAAAEASGCARERHAGIDLPDRRGGRAGCQSAAGILCPRDLAGEPFPGRRGGAYDAQRRACAGDRAVHAGHRERARAARSLQPGSGLAEVRRIPQRVAQPVRQSRTCGSRLQCRTAPRTGMARRHRPDAGADPQLRLCHHRCDGGGLGEGRQHRQGPAERAADELPRSHGPVEARAESVRRRA